VFLADITEHRGLDENAIRSVQAYASECNAELVDWFKLPHQAQPQLSTAGGVFSGLETGAQLWPQIQQRILQLTNNGYAGAVFYVLSYSPLILSEARKLNRPDVVIRTTPVAVLLTKWRASLGSSPTRSYRYPVNQNPHYSAPPALSLREAMDLTKGVLKKYAHTSKQTALLQVQLRPLLMREDQRARKNPLDQRSSRLIANIVSEGVRTGCIGVYDIENIPGTERVWLIDSEDVNRQIAPIRPAAEPRIVPVPESEVPSAPPIAGDNHLTADPSPHSPPPSTAVAEMGESGAPHLVLKERQSRQDNSRSSDKGRKRTCEIIKALKDAGVYSPKRQRDLLFKALRSCLPPGSQPKTLLQLSREIRRQATQAASEVDDFPYWHPATEGMLGMLLGAGVLRNEAGQPVIDGPFAKGSRIGSFDESLEDKCEAFLLETAITSLKDVNKRDRVSLAHALFWDGAQSDRDEVEDRFEHVFGLLADQLVETTGGIWRVEGQEHDRSNAASTS